MTSLLVLCLLILQKAAWTRELRPEIPFPAIGYSLQMSEPSSFFNFQQDLMGLNDIKICNVKGHMGTCMPKTLTSIFCKPFGLNLSDTDDEHLCSEAQNCCYVNVTSTLSTTTSPIEPNRGARILSSAFGFQSCAVGYSSGVCIPSIISNSLCPLFGLQVSANSCPDPSSLFYESCCHIPISATPKPHEEINTVSTIEYGARLTTNTYDYITEAALNVQQVAATLKLSKEIRNSEMSCGKMGSGSIGNNIRAYGRTSRLLGGKNTNVGAHCWHALLLKSYNRRYFCAGTLINKDWILTAAHCVYRLDPKDVVIRLGEWDMSITVENPGHRDYNITKVVTHPFYNSTTLENDLALLKLSPAAHVNQSNICTACLPAQPIDPTGKTCIVAGFGQNEDGVILYPVLKEIDVKIVNDSTCETQLKSTGSLGDNFTLNPNSFLCAAGLLQGEDTCTGDGGGPMVCKIDDTYSLIGIVSWGIGCGKPNIPGVYVNVFKFVNDINEMISDSQLDKKITKPQRLYQIESGLYKSNRI